MTRDERVMLEAYRRFAPIVVEVGGAVVTRVLEAPDSPMLNRAVGLGVEAPATEEDVDRVLAELDRCGAFYVAVSPTAAPPELSRWLEARGLEPGWGWMEFRRHVDDPPEFATELFVEEVHDAGRRAAFAKIVRTGYELPRTIDAVFERMPTTGWACWLARDGEEPVAAAAMFVAEGAAYLSFSATLPAHRGKGGQNALLAARIRRAAELGCDVVLAETGELREGLPSSSYRNLVRNGFEEVGVTANWLGHGDAA